MRLKIAGLALTLALLGPVASAAPSSAPTSGIETVTAEERAEFRQSIRSNPLLALIIEEFPQEFGAFETSLLRDAKAGAITSAEILRRTNVFIEGIQTRYMGFAYQAPDDVLAALIKAHAETMIFLQDVNPRACYELGEGQGLSAETIQSLAEPARKRLQAYGAIELRAGIAGQRARTKRDQPTEQEVMGVVEEFQRLGGDTAWLAALGEHRIDELLADERCANALYWMQAIAAQPSPVLGRVLSME